MSLSSTDWVKLNRLLDEALALQPEQRSGWMESLPPEYASLRDTLRHLLVRGANVETRDVLRQPEWAAQRPPELLAGHMIGPYKLMRELGVGGMASVWLAERVDGALQRQVALKLPLVGWADGSFNERMKRERDILAQLEHPHIARLYDAGNDRDGRPYLAIEYVDGIPLDRYLAERAPSLAERLEIFRQIASGVAFAHSRFIVHRDLKPSNILVKADGTVSLLDFGIARLLSSPSASDRQATQFAGRVYTPQFAAPEQITDGQITAATDVYSLGVLLFELLTGTTPYAPSRSGRAGLEDAVLNGDIRLPSSVSCAVPAKLLRGDLDSIVLRCLQKIPAQRYSTVDALMSDLAAFVSGNPVTARVNTRWYVTQKFVRRNAYAIAGIATVVVALAAGLGVALTQQKRAEAQRAIAEENLIEMQATLDFATAVLSENTQADEAITSRELLERSTKMAEQIDASDERSRIAAGLFISRWHIAYGQDDRAFEVLNKAISSVPQDRDFRSLGEARCMLAGLTGRVGRTQEANTLFDSETARLLKKGDHTTSAYCLVTRAQYVRESDNTSASLPLMLQAKKQFELSGSTSLLERGILEEELGMSYVMAGHTGQAFTHFRLALDAFEKARRENSPAAFNLLSNWSTAALTSGNPGMALPLAERATALSAERSPSGEPAHIILSNQGLLLFFTGRFDDSVGTYRRARELAKKHSDITTEVFALLGIADVSTAQGKLDQAAQSLDEVAALMKGTEDMPMRQRIALKEKAVRARIAQRQEHWQVSVTPLSEVIEAYDKLKCCDRWQGFTLLYRADAHIALQNWPAAVADSERALAIAKKLKGDLPASDLEGLAQKRLAAVYSMTGKREEAQTALTESERNLSTALSATHSEIDALKSLASSQ